MVGPDAQLGVAGLDQEPVAAIPDRTEPDVRDGVAEQRQEVVLGVDAHRRLEQPFPGHQVDAECAVGAHRPPAEGIGEFDELGRDGQHADPLACRDRHHHDTRVGGGPQHGIGAGADRLVGAQQGVVEVGRDEAYGPRRHPGRRLVGERVRRGHDGPRTPGRG
ncbi:hypothetical protein SDC9_148587 [bioreactor metagenome]|uniref:Uncharacterized protein n=1 Tax=bioreactor metagenome TaxID=1076179 RepID=A0A645EH94_9ZZZZ